MPALRLPQNLLTKRRMRDFIVIVLGGPATGKTTVGTRLAKSLRIPYFSKDGVKEPIFDDVGIPVAIETDEPLSGRKMDNAAISILFYLIEMQLKAGCACVIDCNYRQQHSEALKKLLSKYPLIPIQIMCGADGQELEKRYKKRTGGSVRHRGHLDHTLFNEFNLEVLTELYQTPLDIGGHVLSIDSTRFEEADYLSLLESIEQLVS